MPPITQHDWLGKIVTSPTLDALTRRVLAGESVSAQGSCGSSTTVIAGALASRTGLPLLLVVAHLDEADDALEDLELFPSAGFPLPALRFGAMEVLPGETSVSLELLAERLTVVDQLHRARNNPAQPSVIVASIQALMQSVPEPKSLSRFQMTLKMGQSLSPTKLIDWLATAGYNRADAIEQPGDFATRGGILDIYLPSAASAKLLNADTDALLPPGPLPIRLDYFGDEIESICVIDTASMGSERSLESVQLIGASASQMQSDDQSVSVLSLLHEKTIVVLHEILELSEQARGYYERLTNPRGIYAPNAVLKQLTQRPHVQINQYSASTTQGPVVELPVRPLVSFAQDAGKAVPELAELAAASGDESQVVVLCDKPAERDRLLELLTEHAPSSPVATDVGHLHRGFVWELSEHRDITTPDAPPAAPVPLKRLHLTKAVRRTVKVKQRTESPTPSDSSPAPFAVPSLALVPHHELFHRYHNRRRIRRISAATTSGRASDAFLDLDVGDYVVHADHGIARFVGLRTMRAKTVQSTQQDDAEQSRAETAPAKSKSDDAKPSKSSSASEEFLTLEFAQKALLHVPATQIDLVQKYVGGFEGKPPLSMLGGKRWQKQKEQVAEAVKDMAADLLRIQAARASMPGVRYPLDTPWQKEFEAEFPFEETPDQLAAIAAIKKNMADEQPMDRLICGDVGFGKTEVAIRAAFKAIEFGKQVAVLVPTTVLAEQHERTFSERMRDYPFRVESVSRFKTAGHAKEILAELGQGKVDVIIGTHRLLSNDVKFADLGLVIVDEEQRFGVEHKNKLLQLRLTVDVLTLSATPIPRTLHMAMLGLRDISSLSTAPSDRRAVVTEVAPYDEQRVQRAIVRELSRDGQIFFVHNRVHNIQSVADDIKRLVPEARIVIGHGQMPAHELEQVMLTFMRREADVLVSTTIIESGIDIPTANTILINNADQFGLADLHQLRGRVGRYKHRAYCYLLLPPDRPITEIAARRLHALEQYSMLGAGFKIAMRDLEIRGAGNLLGSEQSGHIAAVGYDMYCTLLEQQVKRLRHEKIIEPVKTHLELPGIVGRIPGNYITSDKYRMEAYRRLSRSTTLDELASVERDITDAYGQPPPAVRILIDLTEVRVAASTLDVEAIKLDGPDLIFRTRSPQRLSEVFAQAPGRVSVVDERSIYYRPPPAYLEPPTLLAVLRKLLVRRVQQATA